MSDNVVEKRFISKKPKFSKQLDLHLLMLPAVLLVIVFSYFPMYGIIIAFKNYRPIDGIMGSAWVGMDNFKELFKDPFLERSLFNSVGMSIFRILILFPAPIFLAIMFNEISRNKIKRTYQTISYFPYFISWSVVATMVQLWLSPSQGWVNPLLLKIGLVNSPITFLYEANWFWAITLILEFWKNIGFSTIIFLAAISSVDQEQYEAATIDGASRIKKIKYITWPAISGMVIILFVLQIPSVIGGNFDISYLLGNPSNAIKSDILQTLVYDMGLKRMRFSYSAAVGLVISIVSLILLLGGNKLVKAITKKGLF